MLPRVSTGELWGSVWYRLSFYTLTRQCQGNWSTSTVRPFFALPCKPRRGEGRGTNNNDLGSGQSNARNWKLKVRARVQAVKANLAQAHQRFTFCIGQCLTGFSLASYSNSDWTCWSRCMHVVELSKHKQKWSCSSIGSSRALWRQALSSRSRASWTFQLVLVHPSNHPLAGQSDHLLAEPQPKEPISILRARMRIKRLPIPCSILPFLLSPSNHTHQAVLVLDYRRHFVQ